MIPKDQISLMGSVGGQWSLFWWVIATILIPITLPWTIYRMIGNINQKRQRAGLPGKVVLITGANSGIGEAIAHSFYSAGCKVVLAARRIEELERVRNELLKIHPTVPTHPPVILPLDLADLNSLPNRVDEVLKIFGHIDILINNGGISHRGSVTSTNMDVDIKIMLVNYFGAVALTKAVLPSMMERQTGHIVSLSSVQGRIAIPFRSAYAASKHALQAFSDTLRAEVQKHNINVTVVSPGYVNTALSLNALTGNGQPYGETDITTAGGYAPTKVAEHIISAVVQQQHEIVLAPFKIKMAIFLRYAFPTLFFWLMRQRANSAKS